MFIQFGKNIIKGIRINTQNILQYKSFHKSNHIVSEKTYQGILITYMNGKEEKIYLNSEKELIKTLKRLDKKIGLKKI